MDNTLDEVHFKNGTQLTVIKKPTPLLILEDFTEDAVFHDALVIENSPAIKESSFEKFQRSVLNQDKDYPLPIPVINILQSSEVVNFLTLKSFSLWQGKQKSKKTTVLALAIAAFISGQMEDEGTQFLSTMPGVVLFIDNEQGESYAARTMKLILKLAKLETSSRLIYCDLREFSPTERMAIIHAGIEGTPNVRLVVVDGVVDLMNDFMDAGEGHLTITNLLKLCSLFDIHIAGVLHQNKNDKNARAHVGSIASQKCEIEITTEVDPKDRAQSIVSCMNSRGMPFEPFAIRWDKGSLPCINQEWNELREADAKANKNFDRAKEVAESIFKPLTVLTYTQALTEIMATTLKSKSTAKRSIEDWELWQLINKGTDGNYRIFTKVGSKVHEGSN